MNNIKRLVKNTKFTLVPLVVPSHNRCPDFLQARGDDQSETQDIELAGTDEWFMVSGSKCDLFVS